MDNAELLILRDMSVPLETIDPTNVYRAILKMRDDRTKPLGVAAATRAESAIRDVRYTVLVRALAFVAKVERQLRPDVFVE